MSLMMIMKELQERVEFYQRHVANLTMSRRLQFLNEGVHNELDGIRKLRMPVSMAVEVLLARMRSKHYEVDAKLILSSQKSKPKIFFTAGELNEAKAFVIYHRETKKSVKLMKGSLAKDFLVGQPDGTLINRQRGISKILEVKTQCKMYQVEKRTVLNTTTNKLEPKKDTFEFIQVQFYMFLADCHHGEVLYYNGAEDSIVRAFVELDLELVESWVPILFEFYFYKMLPLIKAHANLPPAYAAVAEKSRKKTKKPSKRC